MLVRIEAPHFVAGLVTDQTQVILAAPILKYMAGWAPWRVAEYVREKQWRLEIVV